MKSAGEIIGHAMRRVEDSRAAGSWCQAMWPALVGKPLALHSRPSRCQEGTLRIEVDSAPWQKQMEDMRQEICARINRAWGGTLLRAVEIRLRRTAGPRETDNEHLPFLRTPRAKST